MQTKVLYSEVGVKLSAREESCGECRHTL